MRALILSLSKDGRALDFYVGGGQGQYWARICNHYDGSGEFAHRLGLPGKSGVGGGDTGIAPGRASIAAWSPGLDASGNSHLGRIALEELTKRMGWSIFAPISTEAPRRFTDTRLQNLTTG